MNIDISDWYRVDLPRFKSREHSIDVMIWCEKMFPEGSCQNFSVTWYFREKKHAEWFILKWL